MASPVQWPTKLAPTTLAPKPNTLRMPRHAQSNPGRQSQSVKTVTFLTTVRASSPSTRAHTPWPWRARVSDVAVDASTPIASPSDRRRKSISLVRRLYDTMPNALTSSMRPRARTIHVSRGSA